MDKKEKKSIYNKRYLEKQKVKQEQKAEKKINEVQEKEDIFFLKNSMPAQPVPVYHQYQQTQTLKQKMIETLAISSISLIPIIAKIIYSRLSIKSEPVEQHTSINLHQLPNF